MPNEDGHGMSDKIKRCRGTKQHFTFSTHTSLVEHASVFHDDKGKNT